MTPFQKRVASAMREYRTSREIADALNACETRVSKAMDKIDGMKTFQPKSIEQQKKNYVKACKQRMTVELRTLEESYREEHDTHAKLYFNRCRIDEKIAKIENRVANEADKEFGGWDKWRHDEALLATVVHRMDAATAVEREKLDTINRRMTILMEPYHEACRKVSNKYHRLMRTI